MLKPLFCLAALFLFALPLAVTIFTTMLWFFWTHCGVGATYFDFLPAPWHAPSWGGVFCLSMTIALARGLTTVNGDVNVKSR
jgi:hypothetical protein